MEGLDIGDEEEEEEALISRPTWEMDSLDSTAY